jgi:hypothetical protein
MVNDLCFTLYARSTHGLVSRRGGSARLSFPVTLLTLVLVRIFFLSFSTLAIVHKPFLFLRSFLYILSSLLFFSFFLFLRSLSYIPSFHSFILSFLTLTLVHTLFSRLPFIHSRFTHSLDPLYTTLSLPLSYSFSFLYIHHPKPPALASGLLDFLFRTIQFTTPVHILKLSH